MNQIFGNSTKCPNFDSGTFSSLFSRKSNRHTIPSCIWNFSLLNTAHFISNKLYGSLGEINVDGNLTSISVIGNLLTGPIPESIQKSSSLINVQLSLNGLTGTLIDGAFQNMKQPNSKLENRMSGEVPPYLYNKILENGTYCLNHTKQNSTCKPFLNGINILNGNLFKCENQSPPIDNDHKTTVGSILLFPYC